MLKKRNGTLQIITFDKIKARLTKLLQGLQSDHINIDLIVTKVLGYVYNGKLCLN